MPTFRVVLVDPHTQTIEEAWVDDVNAFARVKIGDELDHNTLFGPSAHGFGASFIIDDFGASRDGQRYFRLGDYPHALGGRVLFYGYDWRGETVSLSEEFAHVLKRRVQWCPPTMKFERMEESMTSSDDDGAVITIKPIYSGEGGNVH